MGLSTVASPSFFLHVDHEMKVLSKSMVRKGELSLVYILVKAHGRMDGPYH